MQTRRELGQFLNSLDLVGIGIEVGVFRGEFSRQILQDWHGSLLILVDAWRHLSDYNDSWNLSDGDMDRNFRHTLAVLAPFRKRIKILRMLSEEAVWTIPDASCDFVYLDANHSYRATRDDLFRWFPKLRDGGLMCGHDYFDARADERLEPIFADPAARIPKRELTSYGVKSAVDEFARQLGIDIVATNEAYPTWYFQKPR